jgi:hypothetical protein
MCLESYLHRRQLLLLALASMMCAKCVCIYIQSAPITAVRLLVILLQVLLLFGTYDEPHISKFYMLCCSQTTLARAAAAACGAHVIAINGPELLSRYAACSTVRSYHCIVSRFV